MIKYMNIAVIGTGYVGLTTGVCMSKWHNVICIDINEERIKTCNDGICPIYEKDLEALMQDGIRTGKLSFGLTVPQGFDIDVVMLCVGTPEMQDGSVDMQYIWNCASNIADIINSNNKKIVVTTKSTVPPGTGMEIFHMLSKKCNTEKFSIASNPEFLREGSAVSDFMNPDRIVIGSNDSFAISVLSNLYQPFTNQGFSLMSTSLENSEMIKYVSNSMLASRISFINEMANICELFGANIKEVIRGVSYDKRIGDTCLQPGCGYGGSCFPKDVQALLNLAKNKGYHANVLAATHTANEYQKSVIFEKISQYFDHNLTGKTVAVLGLSFKPGTDDVKHSPALHFIEKALEKGMKIKSYDPQGMKNAQKYFTINDICYANSTTECTQDADVIAIFADWQEFKDFNYCSLEKGKVIFDGRNCLNKDELIQAGFKYYGIGIV